MFLYIYLIYFYEYIRISCVHIKEVEGAGGRPAGPGSETPGGSRDDTPAARRGGGGRRPGEGGGGGAGGGEGGKKKDTGKDEIESDRRAAGRSDVWRR